MTPLDRAERVAAGVAVAALAGIGSLALLVGIPTATTAGVGTTEGVGMMGGGMMGGAGAVPFLVFPVMFLAFAGLLALGYVGIRALADGDERDGGERGRVDEAVDTADAVDATDPIARLQRRYTEGELTEAEFERALERELGGEELDGGVDRGADGEGGFGRANVERSASGRER